MNSLWKKRVMGFGLWFVFLGLPGALVSSLYPAASGIILFFTVILPSLIGGLYRMPRLQVARANAIDDQASLRARGSEAARTSAFPSTTWERGESE